MDPSVVIERLVKGLIDKRRPDLAREQIITRLGSCEIDEIPGLVKLFWYIEEREKAEEVEYPEGDDCYLLDTLERLVNDLMRRGKLEETKKIASCRFNGHPDTISDEIKLDVLYAEDGETEEFYQRAYDFIQPGVVYFVKTGLLCAVALVSHRQLQEAIEYAEAMLTLSQERNMGEFVGCLTQIGKVASAELKRQELLNEESMENESKLEKEKKKLEKENKKLMQIKDSEKDDSRGTGGVEGNTEQPSGEGIVPPDGLKLDQAVNLTGTLSESLALEKEEYDKIRKGKMAAGGEGGNESELNRDLELAIAMSLALDVTQKPQIQKLPKFEGIFKIVMDKKTGDNCYTGTVTSNVTTVRKSVIKGEKLQVDKFGDLTDICSKHDSLVTLEHVIKDDEGTDFLVCEVVQGLDYFVTKLKESQSLNMSKPEWWKIIEDVFWTIFRDVIRGLMFLYNSGFGCGDLSFNVFVTEKGRGRLLPSMKEPDECDDVRQLSQIMKTTLGLEPGEDMPFLPHDLLHFFNHLDNYKPSIPIVFFFDHPYGWTLGEKIDFSFKFRNLIKHPTIFRAMEYHLKARDLYYEWFMLLDDVYLEVYFKSLELGTFVTKYNQRMDVSRYFIAVYTHVNERKYDIFRSGLIFDETRVEKDLLRYFPHYYTDMFTCLCNCVSDPTLKEVSSVYHKRAEIRR